jgi:hypothetical protein
MAAMQQEVIPYKEFLEILLLGEERSFFATTIPFHLLRIPLLELV